MIESWLSMAGEEIVNSTRTLTYINALMPGLDVRKGCGDNCGYCENLPRMIEHEPYTTPVGDDAPWIDIDNPNTYRFYGILPGAMVGLMDSTRTGKVVENINNGGWVNGQRMKTREVYVKGTMFAADNAALHAGSAWLKSALDSSCVDQCNGGAEVCYLVDCPDDSHFVGPTIIKSIDLSKLKSKHGTWKFNQFYPRNQFNSVQSPPLSAPLPCGPATWIWKLSGDSGTQVNLRTIGNNNEVISSSIYTLDGTEQEFAISDNGQGVAYSELIVMASMPQLATITETDDISATASYKDVSLREYATFTEGGEATWDSVPDQSATLTTPFNPCATVTEPGDSIVTEPGDAYMEPCMLDGSTWTPGEETYGPVRISVDLEYSEEVDPLSCSEEFFRTLYDVTVLEGPTFSNFIDLAHGGVIATVEFTLVAGNPWVYGHEALIVAGNPTSMHKIDGVIHLDNSIDTCKEVAPIIVMDPDCPPVPSPPQPRSIKNMCINTDPYQDTFLIEVESDLVLSHYVGVPVLKIGTSGAEARQVRVRFYPVPIRTMNPIDIDPCSACGSFVISYIPPNVKFVIDGVRGKLWIEYPNGSLTPAGHLVFAEDGDSFEFPTFMCGMKYFVSIDSQDRGAIDWVGLRVAMRE